MSFRVQGTITLSGATIILSTTAGSEGQYIIISTGTANFTPLRIHATTADPVSPVTGQLWLRSDL